MVDGMEYDFIYEDKAEEIIREGGETCQFLGSKVLKKHSKCLKVV